MHEYWTHFPSTFSDIFCHIFAHPGGWADGVSRDSLNGTPKPLIQAPRVNLQNGKLVRSRFVRATEASQNRQSGTFPVNQKDIVPRYFGFLANRVMSRLLPLVKKALG